MRMIRSVLAISSLLKPRISPRPQRHRGEAAHE
jgi:hypothetical protein